MLQGDASLFSQHVGGRIRFYRRQKQLSQEQLAAAIHKSKSALSKYESGQIPVDIETLYAIAGTVGVEVSQFVDCPIPGPGRAAAVPASPFGGMLYLYYYDGRTKRIVRTALQLQQAEKNTVPCRCYMDVPSFEEKEQCKYYYTGLMTHFELVSYVTLLNHSNPMEQIGLCILNPFHRNRDTWGSAYIEAGQAWLAAEIQTALASEGFDRTHLWCPGQHQFELNNQRALFALLAPEDVGCTLTKRLMMVPAKSVSGIIGIVPAGTENLPVPCDFCRFRPTCPSRQSCAAL